MRSIIAYLVLTGIFTCATVLNAQEIRILTSEGDTIYTEMDPATEAVIEVPLGGRQMHIETQDGNGEWVEAGTMTLQSARPFYTQAWFYFFVLALFAMTLYFLFRFMVNKSRKDAIMAQKVAQLERSSLQSQMNPHFIFNSLNSIQSYIASNENDRANRFLAKFARLIRVMLNNSRSQMVSLQEELDSLRLYLELEKMRFKEKFDFEIILDEDIDPSDIMLPPLLIQPYLENAIIHGLAQKRSQGKINLYYIMDGKYLIATVTDNGIGIEQSRKLKTGGQSLHKSVGMSLTQKRLEMLDEGNKDKKVKLQEIRDRDGVVLGTKVEVKIRVR